jgi:hypothetical protein
MAAWFTIRGREGAPGYENSIIKKIHTYEYTKNVDLIGIVAFFWRPSIIMIELMQMYSFEMEEEG